MPIYEYECIKCGLTTEAMQKFSDAPLTTCAECGGQLKKLISNSSFVLKGTGWYKTDYASQSSTNERKRAANKDSASPTESKSESKSESGTDSKKEAKPETKKEPVSAS
ncbi:MAG: zinc ribbon domain-containing protein [Nitrospirae bacterium]|nr:zinc ribbon domain-containing protein [Nitrospirota bacterium]